VRQQAGGQRVHRVGGQPACHGGSGLPLVSRVLARLKRKHLTLGWQEVHRGLLQAGGGVQAVSNGPVVGDKGRDELPGVHERAQREPVLSEEAGHQHPHKRQLPVVSEGWRGHSLAGPDPFVLAGTAGTATSRTRLARRASSAGAGSSTGRARAI
jgi:hypothetical protein